MKRLSLALLSPCLVIGLFVACGGGSDEAASGDAGADGPNILDTPPGTLSVWTSGPAHKIQPTTAPASDKAITIASYRDAWASAQIAVHGNDGHLEGVKIAAADLSDGQGHTLTKDNVTFYRQVFIDFSNVSKDIGTGNTAVPAKSPTQDGNIGDPLVPLVDPYTGNDAGQPFNVAQNSNQPIFVDVHVPKGLAAGTYTGTIHVTSTVGGAADVPLSVTVWGLDLPDMRTVNTYFKMSINDLFQYHGDLQTCANGNCFFDTNKPKSRDVLKRYENLAHEHRIDTGQSLVNLPINGCTPPSASDWNNYDSAMAPYMDGSYFADGVPSGRFDVPFSPGETFGVDATCGQAEYQALAAAWSTHLKSKGWYPKPAGGGFGAVAYGFDEPLASSSNTGDVQTILNNMAKASTWLQAADPGWKGHLIDTTSPITAPAIPFTSPLLDNALGVYVVALVLYGDVWDHGAFFGREQWQTNPGLFNQGLKLWFYEGNSILPPWPTFATNTLDALEPVIMMWGSWYEHATGFLYWDIAYWTQNDPWGPEISFAKTGDGTLMYPGNHDGTMAPVGSPGDVSIDGPIPSYRLKMIRQGLQDWALFQYAESKGLRSFVEQQVGTVYTQFGSVKRGTSPFWTTDESAMNAIRSAVVAKILSP